MHLLFRRLKLIGRSRSPPQMFPQHKRGLLPQHCRQLLQRLPGIGEKLSQKIVQYREECGQFFSVEEIMEVEGIGKKRYEAIKDYLKVTK